MAWSKFQEGFPTTRNRVFSHKHTLYFKSFLLPLYQCLPLFLLQIIGETPYNLLAPYGFAFAAFPFFLFRHSRSFAQIAILQGWGPRNREPGLSPGPSHTIILVYKICASSTMKFGHNLPRNQVPEWSSSYINYKALKKLIKSGAEGVRQGKEPDLAGIFIIAPSSVEAYVA